MEIILSSRVARAIHSERKPQEAQDDGRVTSLHLTDVLYYRAGNEDDRERKRIQMSKGAIDVEVGGSGAENATQGIRIRQHIFDRWFGVSIKRHAYQPPISRKSENSNTIPCRHIMPQR